MTRETSRQNVALAAQVIEDLTFRPLPARRFRAELVGRAQQPIYKDEGYFVFSGLRPGSYALRISGTGFQSWQGSLPVPLTAPADPLQAVLIDLPGENELLIRVNRSPSANGNGNPRITFDEVVLNRPIPSGAAVLGKGLSTQLADNLGLGPRSTATLRSVEGVEEGSLLRIVRGASIRLRFDPYSKAPEGLTRLLGKVVTRLSATPLQGARVELLQLNGATVERNQDSGLDIYLLQSDGRTLILGTEKDISTSTNSSGDYNLYLSPQPGFELQSAVLRASLKGFRPQSRTLQAQAGKLRHKVDFELT